MGLAQWYLRNRERSMQLFALVDPGAYYDHPIPLRHPFAFYEGHFPAFSHLVLCERALGQPPIDAPLERLFERGIDPADERRAQTHARTDWPRRPAIESFARECDARVYTAIENAAPDNQAVFTVLEHEQMHHETLTYIIHQLEPHRKRGFPQRHHDSGVLRNEFVHIPAGTARLGADPSALPFGWDNEFAGHDVQVAAFNTQRYPISNAEYLRFVRDGGPRPLYWREVEGAMHLRGVFEDLPLPLSWPVYVSNEQAQAYAQWNGCRLMTEAEYDRAAYGTPNGQERRFPWGDDAPSAIHGNFDFVRFDPQPVDAHPAGASAWGVHDLVGNGWEWTSTPFAPLPGFKPMATYPQYSADFFDGKHYVLKGASAVTARELIRRSFRNWFYADYPYMYAKFRCVA